MKVPYYFYINDYLNEKYLKKITFTLSTLKFNKK